MEYGSLGRTGLRVSRLSLGAMTFGAGSGIWGDIAGLDSDQGTRLVAMAVERGAGGYLSGEYSRHGEAAGRRAKLESSS
ncbi:hypothetical protein [Burkholderia multivorans]|uniref:hypothetical protein n=1 Tax=Burkholderia multivorans TaxID=87883 RepID=UPI001FC89989|nr:hypothetical protein [Burkholderia multivorans]